jgi:hypothetical protein
MHFAVRFPALSLKSTLRLFCSRIKLRILVEDFDDYNVGFLGFNYPKSIYKLIFPVAIENSAEHNVTRILVAIMHNMF